jgi:predicted KAP-like P-loop ATPase
MPLHHELWVSGWFSLVENQGQKLSTRVNRIDMWLGHYLGSSLKTIIFFIFLKKNFFVHVIIVQE